MIYLIDHSLSGLIGDGTLGGAPEGGDKESIGILIDRIRMAGLQIPGQVSTGKTSGKVLRCPTRAGVESRGFYSS